MIVNALNIQLNLTLWKVVLIFVTVHKIEINYYCFH